MSSTTVLRWQGSPIQGTTAVQFVWFAAGAVLAFLVPFLFSSELDLDADLYYLVYFASVGAFLYAYTRATNTDLIALASRNWRWSVGLGVLAAAFLVFRVLSAEDSTAHPRGLYFAFEIGWRGVLYGAVDALLLTAFPLAVALGVVGGKLDTIARRGSYLALTIVLVWAITATYHLGYEQFREDGIGPPEIGNTIISVPAIASANPVGAILAHTAMHVTAVTHAYETDTYLPPQTFVESK